MGYMIVGGFIAFLGVTLGYGITIASQRVRDGNNGD